MTLFRQREPDVPTIDDWLATTLTRGQRVGFDPRLLAVAAERRIRGRLERDGIELVPVDTNLVDALRPEAHRTPPLDPVMSLDVAFAGETVADKLASVREALTANDAAAFDAALNELVALITDQGERVPDAEIVQSDAIVPGTGTSLEEIHSLLADDGLIPG